MRNIESLELGILCFKFSGLFTFGWFWWAVPAEHPVILGPFSKEDGSVLKIGLIEKKVVVGGMIPKVMTCIDAVQGGAEASVIMDGRMPHSLLLELFTEHGVGTIIRKNPN